MAPCNLETYPKGPKLQTWLGYEALSVEAQSQRITEAEKSDFCRNFKACLDQQVAPEAGLLVDLMDELVAMDLPMMALILLDSYPDLAIDPSSFRRYHVEATASLLCGEDSRAERALLLARDLLPEEPAPYTNLVQLYANQGAQETALEWFRAGAQICPNHFPLWEVYASMLPEGADAPFDLVLAAAREFSSWVGYSLAAELDPHRNSQTLALYLDPFYKQGEREEAFLLEYTGALGAAGDFDRVLKVVQLELAQNRGNYSWQLLWHSLQASYALGHRAEFELKSKVFLTEYEASIPAHIEGELRAMSQDEEHWGETGQKV
ncbi:MAG: hypothetical protein OXT67_00050 [Zetaproteobacteria bacterium]|nr:hypothetical protein [Zetaproteobacteria bacterium]